MKDEEHASLARPAERATPINQEQDITAIIDCMREVLFTCLDIKAEQLEGRDGAEEDVEGDQLNEDDQA